MKILPEVYTEAFKNRDFLLLCLIVFLYQCANSFIILTLVLNTYQQTGSNFGVSGAVLSFAAPGFFFMAIAGFIADLFDRRKIIIGANAILAVVVLMILVTLSQVHTSILLSFLYFSVNSFLLPASSAASAQIVVRKQLLVANSIFIFTFAGGQLLGFSVASVIIFFFGFFWTLVLSGIFTVIVLWLAFLLPSLSPRKSPDETFFSAVIEILQAFIYILKRRLIWFFFLVFAFMQGLVAFGVTLTPGFFNDVVGLTIDKSPIVIFPLVAIGVVLGAIFMHNPKIRESYFISLGFGTIGLASFILGLLIKLGLLSGAYLLIPIGIFLPALGFGVIISMIASRTVLQKTVGYSAQGTVFGAMVVLAGFFAGVMSPAAATLEALMGYVNILVLGGIAFVAFGLFLAQAGKRWKF